MSHELQAAFQLTPPAGGLDSHMLLIFSIMLLAGALGGAANYFLSDRQAEAGRRGWARYPVLGIVVALTVPLFLNMISSTLLEGARVRPIDLYVFAGFCLIYVIASRRLIDNVADRLLGQVDQVRRDMGKLQGQLKEREAKEREAQEAAAQQKTEKPETAVETRIDPEAALSYNDIEILRVLSEQSFICGNLAALCEQTGLERELVSQRLAVMKNMGVIETRINESSVLFWFVPARGKQVLSRVLAGQDDKKAA